MNRKSLWIRIWIAVFLSGCFKYILGALNYQIKSDLLFNFLNILSLFIVMSPLVKPVIYLYSSKNCKGFFWKILKVILALWFTEAIVLIILSMLGIIKRTEM